MLAKKLVRFDWAMKYILPNKANFDVLEALLPLFKSCLRNWVL